MKQENKKEQLSLLNFDFLTTTINKYRLLFGICILGGLLIAFAYNYFKTPVYEVSSSILIKSEDRSSQIPTQIFQDMNINVPTNNFQNELQLLVSTPSIKEALNNINTQVSYFHKKILKTEELYKNSPFIVVFNQNHPQPVDVKFNIKILDDNSFKITAKGKDIKLYSFNSNTEIQKIDKFKLNMTGEFDSPIESEEYDFKILLNENFTFEDFSPNKYSFIIHNPYVLIKNLKSSLKVEPNDFESTVANLSLETTVPEKAIDFINSLIEVYLNKSLEKKIHLSVKTVEYIDSQLTAIKDSLRNAEENLQRYRTTNQVMDINSKSGRIYDQLQDLNRQKAEIQMQYKYYEYINNYFEKNKEYSDLIAPSSMGIEDPLLNNMIQELLQVNAERLSLIDNNQEKSPYLKKLNIQIDNLRNTISENIKYIINTTEIRLKDIESRIRYFNNEINKLPMTERKLFGYERKFNINDAIYTYMLENKSEAEIAKASYLPDAEVVDAADIVGEGPISPRKAINYMLGLLLGFLIPYGTLKIIHESNTRITDRNVVEKLTDIPIIGSIYSNNKKVDLVIKDFPKSHIAESFRMVRTNLNYFLQKSDCSVIAVTSTLGQEGKSFISLNLSASLATANFKSIVLGYDLRKPKVFSRLGISEKAGISNYLIDQVSIDEIIQPTKVENLDFITSGEIPPNPSELIVSPKTGELITYLKQHYRYIIIDTPPIGLISDGFHLINFADLVLYIVRQNQTPKSDFITTINDLKEKKPKSLGLVINDISLGRSSKYGYDYYVK